MVFLKSGNDTVRVASSSDTCELGLSEPTLVLCGGHSMHPWRFPSSSALRGERNTEGLSSALRCIASDGRHIFFKKNPQMRTLVCVILEQCVITSGNKVRGHEKLLGSMADPNLASHQSPRTLLFSLGEVVASALQAWPLHCWQKNE